LFALLVGQDSNLTGHRMVRWETCQQSPTECL